MTVVALADLCELDERMLSLIRECNVMYEILKQDEGDFDVGWTTRTVNSTVNDTTAWYRSVFQ